MNVFRFELKSVWSTLLIWSLALVAVMLFFLGGVYPILLESRAEIEAMLAGFPPAFLAAFGLDTEQLFGFFGYYNFSFMYFGLIGITLAAKLALTIMGREKRCRAHEFLLVKPRTRLEIFCSKLAAVVTALVPVNLVYVLCLIVAVRLWMPDVQLNAAFFQAAGAMFLTQLVFVAIGVAVATFFRRLHSVSGLSTMIGLLAYVATALANLLEREEMTYLAPLKYFEPQSIHRTGHFEIRYVATAVVVVAGCLIASAIQTVRHDVRIN